MRIAVDAMGGDYAPFNIVKGSVEAARELSDDQIVLVGPESLIWKQLEEDQIPENILVVHADEVIGMDEPVSLALRKKKNSSLHVSLNLVKEGKADAFFTAGNTAAVVALSKILLGTEEEVDRPGILAVLPTLKKEIVMIDLGANVEAKLIHYKQYALMAKAFAENFLNRKNPSVGVLSIGEEATKGHALLKKVNKAFREAPFNFFGNIEGKDIFFGIVDVVVTDGFVGNIVLKLSEGLAEVFGIMLKRELKKSLLTKLFYLVARKSFREFRRKIDYAEYGGAILLGVKGNIIVGHGRSSARAVKNAVISAKRFISSDLRGIISKTLSAHRDWLEKEE